jgi:NADH-quinone oxidoreductase subunit F
VTSATDRSAEGVVIRVCKGTGCVMSGAAEVAEAFSEELASHAATLEGRGTSARVELTQSGCQGLCEQGPLVTIEPEGILYVRVDPMKAARIVALHLIGGKPVKEFFYQAEAEDGTTRPVAKAADVAFFAKQKKIVLRRCGKVDPEDIEDCMRAGAYQGIAKVLGVAGPAMTPEQVIEEVTGSGLRGRGGAGFPTALKWKLAREAPGDKKYVICNGDEGDPGAFMDGATMEGDPHSVIEGMLIGAFAIGADEGYIYVRAEYPLAVRRLKIAIEQAYAKGFLGDDVLGVRESLGKHGKATSDEEGRPLGFSFDLHIKEGAGAFVCGEETALMNSIEGKRGMPRVRPPFPAQSGLWGKPTNINNVETWATVEWIITNGGSAYAAVGNEDSHGTKIFSVTGKVKHTGLVEVPMGSTTVRDVIFGIAGGVPSGRTFKAVQMGGPSGGCLPAEQLDLPIEYKALTAAGAIVGSGGMVVVDERTCMVDLARYFLSFTQSESCGKCVPCRVGTKRMLEVLERICAGQGREGDIDELETLAADVRRASLCGLGQTAPNPLLTTLRYFRDEYVAHVRDKRCPAGHCAALIELRIDPETCTKCKACLKACPAEAISLVGEGEDAVYVIDQALCTKCRSCVAACRTGSIGALAVS